MDGGRGEGNGGQLGTDNAFSGVKIEEVISTDGSITRTESDGSGSTSSHGVGRGEFVEYLGEGTKFELERMVVDGRRSVDDGEGTEGRREPIGVGELVSGSNNEENGFSEENPRVSGEGEAVAEGA